MTGHKDRVAVRGGASSRSSRCNRPFHDRPIWHGAVAPGGPSDYRGWPTYGGGSDNIYYSALAQINRDDVRRLVVAWT